MPTTPTPLDSAIDAAKAGFDSIVYDLSALPFAENVKQTRQAVEVLKAIYPNDPRRRRDWKHRNRALTIMIRFLTISQEALYAGRSKAICRKSPELIFSLQQSVTVTACCNPWSKVMCKKPLDFTRIQEINSATKRLPNLTRWLRHRRQRPPD